MDPTPANLQALQVSVSMAFDRGVARAEQWWQQIASDVTSTTTQNIFPWEEMLPDYRKWVGERVVHRPIIRYQALVNDDFEDTVGIPKNALDDDSLGLYRGFIEQLGEAGSNLWNRLVIEAIKRGLTTTVYDGQFFFDVDHPVDVENAASPVMSNKVTGALSLANVRAARALMRSYKQANGRNYLAKPNLLVVGTANENAAIDILEADIVAVGNAGVTNVMKNKLDLLVVPEFDEISATAWMLLDTTKRVKPFIVQRRKEPAVALKNLPTDDNVFWENEVIAGGHARGASGFGQWWTAIYSTGTT